MQLAKLNEKYVVKLAKLVLLNNWHVFKAHNADTTNLYLEQNNNNYSNCYNKMRKIVDIIMTAYYDYDQLSTAESNEIVFGYGDES